MRFSFITIFLKCFKAENDFGRGPVKLWGGEEGGMRKRGGKRRKC